MELLNMKISKILPFRLKSERFPNKPLSKIFNKTLLENSICISEKINYGKTILTCSEKDFNKVQNEVDLKKYNFNFLPSSSSCSCATDRVLEIYDKLDSDIFISIPIDEALLIPEEINNIILNISNYDFDVLTFYCNFYNKEDAISKLSAKITTNKNQEILYLSRSIIPITKNGDIKLNNLKKNVGVFFFKKHFLDKLKLKHNVETTLDKIEGLEQLRWLELGFKIKILKIKHYGFGIDIPEQIKLLEDRRKCSQKQQKSE